MDHTTNDAAPGESAHGGISNDSWLRRVKYFVSRTDLTTYAYSLFITSYFFTPYEKAYKLTFYLAVAPLFFLAADRRTIELLKRSIMFRYSVLWLVYLSLTLIWSPDVELSDFDDVARGLILLVLFIAITIDFAWRDPLFTRRLFTCLFFVAPVAAAISIIVFFSVHDVGSARLIGLGVLNHPITAAYFYAIVALTTLFGMNDDASTGPRKLLVIGVLAILFAFIVLTASRGPALALGAAILTGAIMTRNRMLLLAIMLPGLALAAIGIIQDIGPYNVLARASNYRVEVWTAILDRISDNFWFGVGIAGDTSVLMSSGSVATHAHQLFLGNHFYGGVPATALLLVTLATAARVALRHFRSTGQVVHVALLTFVVVAGMVDFGEFLRSPNLIWFYFWLPIALIAGQEMSSCRDAPAAPADPSRFPEPSPPDTVPKPTSS